MYSVYIVDDDDIVLDEIIRNIEWLENGFEIVGFSSCPLDAIDKILALQPDLVFTDLKMSALDGVEFIKTLLDLGLNCEFIMLSAFPSFAKSREFFRLNGFDYILKPLKPKEIQIVLQRLATKLSTQVKPKAQSPNIVPNFLQMIDFVSENYQKKYSLVDLGKQFALSPNYICNLFSKHYNTTLTRFVTDIRMKKAEEQILNGERVFKIVASNCGYSDYYYFCRVFKEYFGQSPSNFAKSIDKNGKYMRKPKE